LVVGVILFSFQVNRQPYYSWQGDEENPSARFLGEDAYFKKLGKLLQLWGVILSAFLLIGIFCPTTNQMATIYVLPEIINNEQVQKMPQKMLDATEKQLDKWVDEATEKATKAIQNP